MRTSSLVAFSFLTFGCISAEEYSPYSHSYTLDTSKSSVIERHDSFQESHGIIGLAINGIPFLVNHYDRDSSGFLIPRPLEGEFDDCGGHGDTSGHYHYHIPPLCLLRDLGSATPEASAWWHGGGHGKDTSHHWPQFGSSVRVGMALDGAPILGPYHPLDGRLLLSPTPKVKSPLDACHGMQLSDGTYAYFLTATHPFLPPCLQHRPGLLRGFESKGVLCEEGVARPAAGCPNHPWFRGTTVDPSSALRRLTNATASSTTTTVVVVAGSGTATTTKAVVAGCSATATTTGSGADASGAHKDSVALVGAFLFCIMFGA